MKGIFWNSRGLSDLAKYKYISDTIKDHKLDFVAVMETGKQDLSRSNINRLSGGADFIWHCLPPRGRSGGVLLGINSTALDLSLIVEGEFFIKFHLRNKNDDLKWILMAVYGPAQDDFKSAFLSELVRTCQQNPWPTLIGGISTSCVIAKKRIRIISIPVGLFSSTLSSIALILARLT